MRKLGLIAIFLGLTITFNGQTVDAGPDRSICITDSVALNAGPAMTYSWSPIAGLSDSNIGNPVAFPQSTTTYTLTATDNDGMASVDEITIFVINSLDINAGPDQNICFGTSVSIGDSPELDVTYTWSPDSAISAINDAMPTVDPEETTTYTVTAENGSCIAEDEVTVFVSNINVDFDYYLFPLCDNFELQLVNQSDPAAYEWNFWDGSSSNEDSPSLMVEPNEDIFVTLRETQSNCNFNKTIDINLTDLEDFIEFSATNVFSPNGDGINDYMDVGITGNLEQCMELIIYNRWGERMFVSTGGNSRWDGYTIAGQLAAPGTYFYTAEVQGIAYKGSVQVLY